MEQQHSISQDHWDWVRDLIRDIEPQEKCNEFLRQFFQWDQAIREFRKIEHSRMILGSPTERDIHCHAICVHALLTIGHSLILQSKEFKADEMQHCNVEHDHIDSYVEELEQSLREWHHSFTDAEVKAAQDKIFGARA